VPLNYQILLGVGALLSIVGLFYLRRLRLPVGAVVPAPARPRRRVGLGGLRRSLAAVLAQRSFVRFASAAFVLHWGLYLPGALWSVLRVRDLGASDTWIGLIAVVIDATTIGGYLLWNRVTAKKGDRWLLVVTTAGISVYAFLTGLVPTIGWMVPTSILGGLMWSGCNLALFNVMLGVCPEERRPTYIGLYTALMNVTAFAGPLLGAALSDWVGIRPAFMISAGVRFLGALLFIVLR
jgi:MFS family permease